MSENPFAGQGAVMLDIGGDVGALVVTMPPSMVGAEIEIDAVGAALVTGTATATSRATGTAIAPRPCGGRGPAGPDGSQPSLVFPELVEGSYELFDKGAETCSRPPRSPAARSLSWSGRKRE